MNELEVLRPRSSVEGALQGLGSRSLCHRRRCLVWWVVQEGRDEEEAECCHFFSLFTFFSKPSKVP
jgi:hypothetical protein